MRDRGPLEKCEFAKYTSDMWRSGLWSWTLNFSLCLILMPRVSASCKHLLRDLGRFKIRENSNPSAPLSRDWDFSSWSNVQESSMITLVHLWDNWATSASLGFRTKSWFSTSCVEIVPIVRPFSKGTKRKSTCTEVPNISALEGVDIEYSILLGHIFSTDYQKKGKLEQCHRK